MNNIPDTSFEIAIIGGHNVNTVLNEAIYQAVVGIGSFMIAFDSLKPRVFGYPQCKSVFRAKLLEFRHDTIGHNGDTFRIQAIHHCWDHLQFVLDGMGDEIGVNQN